MNVDTSRSEADAAPPVTKPTRPTEAARLSIARLTLESGLTIVDVFQTAAKTAAQTLNVERFGVWLLLEDRTALRCATLFEMSRSEFRDGSILQSADFPTYFAALTQRKIVPAEVAQHDPITSELAEFYLKPLNISSTLDAPILVGGAIAGVVCCEHVGDPREWSTEERDFVASVADILAVKIRSAEVHQLRSLMQLTERRVLANEKTDSLAKMALGISHDFRNILTVIQNCAELISASNSSAKVKELNDLILEAVKRGVETVRALADFGREGQNQPTILDPSEEILAFKPILHAALTSAYRIDLQLEQDAGKIIIDRNRFQRILLNLVMNAKDALPYGGTIDVRAYRRKSADQQSQDRVAIEIRDHGAGIDDSTLERIFEPFFTTKADGSGLGLTIVSRIVELAGGQVEVESKGGKGSTFRLVFPIVAQ